MAKRLIAKGENYKVIYSNEWNEYSVVLLKGATEANTSYHSDKQDAIDTMKYLDHRKG